MFPTHTKFEIKRVEDTPVLVAVTTYKSIDIIGDGIETCSITTGLGILVDKEYPVPIRFRVLQDRIIFEDLEFEKAFRGEIL